MIALCAFFAFATLNAFGQKPKKPIRQANTTTTTATTQQNGNIKPTNNTPACWMITGKNGDIEYRWDTEANVQQWINEMRTQHNEIYEYTTSTAKDVDACDAKNEKQNSKKCWKITASKNGQGIEQYLWSTETVARRKAASLQNDGYQNVIYTETPANEEKSCMASEEEPTCWEITINNAISYHWGFESEAANIVNNARNSGKTASYRKTTYSKDSCLKGN